MMLRLHLDTPPVTNSSAPYPYAIPAGRRSTASVPLHNVIVKQPVAGKDNFVNRIMMSNGNRPLEGTIEHHRAERCIYHSSQQPSNGDSSICALYSPVLIMTIYSEGQVTSYYETSV